LRYGLLLSFKYRLKTSREQAEILGEQLRLCRPAYNTLLGHCFDERKAGRGTPQDQITLGGGNIAVHNK